MLGPDREPLGELLLPDRTEVWIGRGEDNDIVVRDPTVSRRHASVRKADDGLTWFDQGSSNGTWLGEQRIDHLRLRHGDRLRIGSTTMLFLCKKRSLVELLTPGSGDELRSGGRNDSSYRVGSRSGIAMGDTPDLPARLIVRRESAIRVWAMTIGLGVLLVSLILVSLLLLQ